eukprot:TRINITY_DN7457_c0_g2_i1.p1 TRINITY_DN7457_c0_g2~~TRINITY_DN7457_c0_g2_i1.p1  ORF type:complete len:846 (+),score=174.00 TRINITY_DN7457_c0_g2_i1:1174-3711(+)
MSSELQELAVRVGRSLYFASNFLQKGMVRQVISTSEPWAVRPPYTHMPPVACQNLAPSASTFTPVMAAGICSSPTWRYKGMATGPEVMARMIWAPAERMAWSWAETSRALMDMRQPPATSMPYLGRYFLNRGIWGSSHLACSKSMATLGFLMPSLSLITWAKVLVDSRTSLTILMALMGPGRKKYLQRSQFLPTRLVISGCEPEPQIRNIFLQSMATSCMARMAPEEQPPIRKSTLSTVMAFSTALVALTTLRISLVSILTSLMGIFWSPTFRPPSLLISSAAISAPYQACSPCTNFMGPRMPILISLAWTPMGASRSRATRPARQAPQSLRMRSIFITSLPPNQKTRTLPPWSAAVDGSARSGFSGATSRPAVLPLATFLTRSFQRLLAAAPGGTGFYSPKQLCRTTSSSKSSLAEPLAIIWPWDRTQCRLARSKAKLMSCSVSRMVIPMPCTSLMRSKRSSLTRGARPTEGSSINRNLAWAMRQRPMASMVRSPPEMVPETCFCRFSRMGKSWKTFCRFSSMRPLSLHRWAPTSRFSRTFISRKGRPRSGQSTRPCWTISWARMRLMACCPNCTSPLMVILPPTVPLRASFSHFTRPATARSRVVLPAPLGPTMLTISPSSTNRLTLLSTMARSQRTVMLSTLSCKGLHLLPDVSLDHLLVGHHLLGGAHGQNLAETQDDDPVHDGHQLGELVLHDHHGRALAVQPAEAAALMQALEGFGNQPGFGGVQAPERLVQQQQVRLGGDGPGQLQALEVAVGEHRGRLQSQVRDAAKLQGVPGPELHRLDPLPFAARAAAEAGHHNVGHHRQVAEGLDYLKGTGQAHINRLVNGLAGDLLPLVKHLA